MATIELADQYYTYENRLASFQTAHQLSKRRASNASSKTPKSLKWPHKFLAAEELARAGFFYYPTQANPDNVACFLCQNSLDGWEKGDDPLAEHLKHAPECGWAIVATIAKEDGELSQEYPLNTRMIEARKSTFSDKWPHESKKGWKCKTKQMVDAGWKYTPTPEYDDMATCTYCELALDGWEPGDKPMEEHFKRSPECTFFALISTHKQSPEAKRTKARKGRTSKASRLSTQSAFTVNSDVASVTDLTAEEGDSILTTATNATASQPSKKPTKGKKAPAKGRKTKANKSEAVEVLPAPEPEDDDFEVKVEVPSKPTRERKRKSDDLVDTSVTTVEELSAPPAKRRATRTRSSVAGNDSILGPDDSTMTMHASKPTTGARKKGRQSMRKASAASVASLRTPIPNDDELDAALEADLDQRMTDDEEPTMDLKPSTGIHSMFDTEAVKIDEAVIDAELAVMEEESRPLPKAKGAKGKQPRKVSAKQQAAAKKAAEVEAAAAAKRAAEKEEEASHQISMELEQSISIQHSSPEIKSKRQRASRQPSRQLPGRRTRGSVLSVNESHVSFADDQDTEMHDQNDESGNETDASMASQSTVVRASKTRRGSTMRKGKAGKKAATRHIEEIVQKNTKTSVADVNNLLAPPVEEKVADVSEDVSMADERFYTPAPEMHSPIVEEPIPQVPKQNPTKPRGRPPKAAQPIPPPLALAEEEIIQEDYPLVVVPQEKAAEVIATPKAREQTPPLRERTPSASPQSSDAENHPPSSKPATSVKKVATPHSTTTRIPLAAATPSMSPSKRNIIAGLQTSHPWTAVDLDAIFLKTPGNENAPGNGLIGDALENAKHGDLTSPEKRMTVEQWIHRNAEMAEDRLKHECERMVGTFEREGTRAMTALEGIDCIE